MDKEILQVLRNHEERIRRLEKGTRPKEYFIQLAVLVPALLIVDLILKWLGGVI